MDFPSAGSGRDDEIRAARGVPAPGTLDPVRTLLHSISSRLAAQEVSAMKFLCRDKIGKRKLDAVQSGYELFDILIEQGEISRDNLELLKKLLQHIKRRDLLSEVEQFEEEGPGASDDQPDEREKCLLRAAVAVIGNYVGREWKRLMRELRIPEVKLESIEAAYPWDLSEKLFQGLREWQKRKGKDAKVADLITALQGCNLTYVAEKVEERISQLNTGAR